MIEADSGNQISATVEDVLRGLIWACLLIDDTDLAHIIGNLTLMCFNRIRGQGVQSQKVGYACLYTLSWMASDDAVGELYRIQPLVRTVKVRRRVASALNEAANRRGLNLSHLDEIAVPTFGLDSERCYPECPAGYRAKFEYRPCGRIRVDWYNPNGKRLKSTPAVVRREHAEALNQIRQIQKTANILFVTQRTRIERLFIEDRLWSLKDWRARYLDHAFVNLLARLLIWQFEQGEQRADAIWLEGQLVDL